MAARVGGIQQTCSSSRPELGSFSHLDEHEYAARITKSRKVSLLESAIENCSGAISKVYSFEKQLFLDGTISREKPALPSLEKTMLDLACNTEVSEGVLYSICCRFEGDVIVRFFESGCYNGFMKKFGCDILKTQHALDNLNMINLYTETDIKDRQTKSKCKVDQVYKRLLQTNKTSIENQLSLLKESFLDGPKEATLLSLIVHCKRKSASSKHRYLSVYPDTEEITAHWEDALQNHIVTATGLVPIQLLDLIESGQTASMSLKDQFNFISLLPNNHWLPYMTIDGKMSSGCTSFVQHLLYQVENGASESHNPKPALYPTSLRNRMLYFFMLGITDSSYMTYARRLCDFYISQITGESQVADVDGAGNQLTSTNGQPSKRRRYTERVVTATPQMVEVLAKNVALPRTLYVDFREQLFTSGHVSLRSLFQCGGVFLLNDYNDENGHFMPLSFAHLTFIVTGDHVEFDCSCSSFSYIHHSTDNDASQSSITCMHCRFGKDFLLDICRNPTSIRNLAGQTNLHKKVLAAYGDVNCGVVVLSEKGTIKMSVRENNGTCAFVHLSACRTFVCCKRGKCGAIMKNKKKTLKLLNPDNHQSICEHLQTLHSNKESWFEFLPPIEQLEQGVPGGDRVNTDDYSIGQNLIGHFDTNLNLWNFGGLSQHKPLQRLTPSYEENVIKRDGMTGFTLKRNADHELIGPTFKPELPETCACGAGYDEDDLVEDYDTRLFVKAKTRDQATDWKSVTYLSNELRRSPVA